MMRGGGGGSGGGGGREPVFEEPFEASETHLALFVCLFVCVERKEEGKRRVSECSAIWGERANSAPPPLMCTHARARRSTHTNVRRSRTGPCPT